MGKEWRGTKGSVGIEKGREGGGRGREMKGESLEVVREG